ncbi:MAG: hypothetical protein HRT35_11110 [Algicola sp.]|nr:hypothetical protein [Algicola sp.]
MKIFITVLTVTLLLTGSIWFATSEEYAPVNQIVVTDLSDVFEVITGQYQSEPEEIGVIVSSKSTAQSVQPLDVYLDFANDEETRKDALSAAIKNSLSKSFDYNLLYDTLLTLDLQTDDDEIEELLKLLAKSRNKERHNELGVFLMSNQQEVRFYAALALIDSPSYDLFADTINALAKLPGPMAVALQNVLGRKAVVGY